MPPLDEKQSIVRILAGDIDLYTHIVRCHHRDVYRIVSAMLYRQDQAEELAQEVFVAAFEHLDQFKLHGDFGRWIKEIARNTVRMELRRRSREERRRDSCRELLPQILDNETSSEEEQQRLAALAECRQRLAPKLASVFHLRYAENLSLQEIAGKIQSTAEAVRKILARGRLMLRDCIQEKMALL